MVKKQILTSAKRKMYTADAATLSYWRRNPVIAAKDLLGVELLDFQKWLLQSMWIASHICLCCGRNLGKSFIGSVFLILWSILMESQELFIISSVGEQAKETFGKCEQLILRTGKTSSSFKDLKDIAAKEVITSPTNKTGFSHNPSGYTFSVFSGSKVHTLNSNPDNARSRRASVVFFDEAAYCTDELLIVGEAFAAQSSDFVTSTDENYDPSTEPLKPPSKLIYASSQDTMTTLFYRYYKDFAKRMLAGDRDYFCCDLSCEVAFQTYMNGKPYAPLLTRDKVEAALKSNRDKALREYYNQPQLDAGAAGICGLGQIRRAETFDLPALAWEPGYCYAIAFDPARTHDQSIIAVMRMYEDSKLGWVGDICHVKSLVDIKSDEHYKMDSNRQVAELRNILVDYSGNTAIDYEYIDAILIDAGAGGGGVSAYGDALLNSWVDSKGDEHRGLIDTTYDIYSGYEEMYPDAVDKLRMISPRKWRTTMVEEFIEMMKLGCIRFPREYRSDIVTIITGQDKTGEDILESRELTMEEILSLQNIDLMKNEIVSIQKTQNAEHTTVQYALSKDKALTTYDDKFYCAIMLAHWLYQKRKGAALESHKVEEDIIRAPICVSALNI